MDIQIFANRNLIGSSPLRLPDLVIINLGTNDVAMGSLDRESDFKKAVEDLIKYIRTSYGKKVNIVWAYNMMGNCRADWTLAVLESMGGEAEGLYSVKLTENRNGGNGHPTLEAQQQASVDLTAFIRSKNLI